MLGYKRLNLTVNCQAVYNSSILVPANLTFEEAIAYAYQHLDQVPVGPLEYMSGSETLDTDNCDFDEDDTDYVLYRLTTTRPDTKTYILKTANELQDKEKTLISMLVKQKVDEADSLYQLAQDAYISGTTGQEPVRTNPNVLNDGIIHSMILDVFNITGILLQIVSDEDITGANIDNVICVCL